MDRWEWKSDLIWQMFKWKFDSSIRTIGSRAIPLNRGEWQNSTNLRNRLCLCTFFRNHSNRNLLSLSDTIKRNMHTGAFVSEYIEWSLRTSPSQTWFLDKMNGFIFNRLTKNEHNFGTNTIQNYLRSLGNHKCIEYCSDDVSEYPLGSLRYEAFIVKLISFILIIVWYLWEHEEFSGTQSEQFSLDRITKSL